MRTVVVREKKKKENSQNWNNEREKIKVAQIAWKNINLLHEQVVNSWRWNRIHSESHNKSEQQLAHGLEFDSKNIWLEKQLVKWSLFGVSGQTAILCSDY